MTSLFDLLPAVHMGYHPLNLLDRFLEEWPLTGNEHGGWTPPADIAETDKDYLLSVELPGVDLKGLDITYSEGVLTIKGEKRKEGQNGHTCHFSERYAGPFERSFRIPEKIDVEKIEASYADGVLRVVIPKPEESVPKKIEVH
ncbi:MAG: Hsp20/alpha crystallin family protein [Deltaproteobacteria bacterium]|nr:Hsp20/alpha crystallin family protein [Deltaproteobacteria bacterium]MBW1921944.1 Hsp20/alpha crystallin family protein [Deltaproteobacteria bacterium]MBW1948788.1 Hsp20/alpha crystallin family protein [Deltaproteobacteria bacterium]MBW2006465.1 Hsp20/alpha crystallin family protein [Deltaproteobacteria bacterium]MBW2101161.1 Hsp20/alpha crystallin family protein [Deltaproteobacteria bacterium]